VISPFVQRGSVFNGPLDHTTILQLIGEKFGDGQYSQIVDDRISQGGLGSVADVLSIDQQIADPPSPPPVTSGYTTATGPYDTLSTAFGNALAQMKKTSPAKMAERFPKLSRHF
jgi:phospholipase C